MHSGSSGTGEAIHYLHVLVGSGFAEVEVAQVARIFLLPIRVFVPCCAAVVRNHAYQLVRVVRYDTIGGRVVVGSGRILSEEF